MAQSQSAQFAALIVGFVDRTEAVSTNYGSNACNRDVSPIDESSTCSYIVVLETCSPPMPPAPERALGGTSCLVSTGQAAALESAGRNLVFALLGMDLGSDGSDPGRAPGGSDQNRL